MINSILVRFTWDQMVFLPVDHISQFGVERTGKKNAEGKPESVPYVIANGQKYTIDDATFLMLQHPPQDMIEVVQYAPKDSGINFIRYTEITRIEMLEFKDKLIDWRLHLRDGTTVDLEMGNDNPNRKSLETLFRFHGHELPECV
ncbi:MAG TPA: hypothetical protein PKD49_06330 [Hyphomicrobium sp.]|nr:hypothetical protein [Hyphomicrobium sp.]